MMGHSPFYFSTTDRAIIAFGSLFDDMHIERTDENDDVVQVLRVPLTYAPKNKLLLRADVDPDASKDAAIELPRMAFSLMNNYVYDSDRRLTHLKKFVSLDPDNANNLKREYVPVPYNLDLELYVYAKHFKDGNKIIEQILPFFTPDWTVNIEFVPEIRLNFDVPIILKSISIDDSHWDGNFTERRVLVWTLAFQMKTYFLGPVKSKPIIKFSHHRQILSSNTEISMDDPLNVATDLIVSPGMDANGNPTSNSSITVDPNIIFANDTFGYVEEFGEGFEDD